MKSFALALLAVCVLSLPAEAGLLDKLRGGRGGDDPCADGSCGRPIGMGLKKPGQEVGQVTGDGMFVKMYAAQPEQPQYDVPLQPAEEKPKENWLTYVLTGVLACCLLTPVPFGIGLLAYVGFRELQE